MNLLRIPLLITAVTLCTLPQLSFGQKTLLAGDTVRAIYIGSWVQDSLAGEKPFEGKTVVLEFWSTWCGPCIKAIPHLNALAKEFANENVVFAAVSNERAVTAKKFLEKTPMNMSVFVDTENSLTHILFGVRVIPRTFIIGRDGVIRWTGHPDRLTRELLRQHIAAS
jgi:thiol-disulfide isomerase/thioredoxin